VISPVATSQELADMLTQRTFTLCSGFFVAGHDAYLFLNDATSEDGAGEYGACKRLGDERFVQIESITFSWMDAPRALEMIRQILAGECDASAFAHTVDLRGRLDRLQDHGRCHFCA
jgi:hypothetical protein